MNLENCLKNVFLYKTEMRMGEGDGILEGSGMLIQHNNSTQTNDLSVKKIFLFQLQ